MSAFVTRAEGASVSFVIRAEAQVAAMPLPKAHSSKVLLAHASIERQQGSVLDVVLSRSLPVVQSHSTKAQMQPANWDSRDLLYYLL